MEIREVPNDGLVWDCELCGVRGRVFTVSEEDPDSTLSDVFNDFHRHSVGDQHRMNEVHESRSSRR